jgi:hypothetical protein
MIDQFEQGLATTFLDSMSKVTSKIVNSGEIGVLVQFENTPKALANSIRVASTLGLTEKSDPTLKAFANAVWPTLSALNFF